jgi:hypothetical protein
MCASASCCSPLGLRAQELTGILIEGYELLAFDGVAVPTVAGRTREALLKRPRPQESRGKERRREGLEVLALEPVLRQIAERSLQDKLTSPRQWERRRRKGGRKKRMLLFERMG